MKNLRKHKQLIGIASAFAIGFNTTGYAFEIPLKSAMDIWEVPNHEITEQIIDEATATPTPIPTPEPTPTPTPIPIYEQVVNTAKQYIGVPYVWGGTTPKGFDCSGFVQYVYAQMGVSISRTTATQIYDGTHVDRENLRQGDLVFFGSKNNIHHVGIYVGNNQYIHAPQTGETVKISNLSDRHDYTEARRIIE